MSVQQIAKDMDLKVEQRHVSVDELPTFNEAGCLGTAAVITPVEAITHRGKDYVYTRDGKAGPITAELYKRSPPSSGARPRTRTAGRKSFRKRSQRAEGPQGSIKHRRRGISVQDDAPPSFFGGRSERRHPETRSQDCQILTLRRAMARSHLVSYLSSNTIAASAGTAIQPPAFISPSS